MENKKRLIDFEKVYEVACKGCIRHGEELGECFFDEPCERLIFAFTTAEPVDAVEVVHGRWIEKQEPITWCEDGVDIFYECSVCETLNFGESPYCPHCGAKMDGDENA